MATHTTFEMESRNDSGGIMCVRDIVVIAEELGQAYLSGRVGNGTLEHPRGGGSTVSHKGMLLAQRYMVHTALKSVVELEARAGRWIGNKFTPGVSKDTMERALRKLCNYDHWSTMTDWQEFHDFFHRGGPDEHEVRTTTCVKPSDDSSMRISHTHVVKVPVYRCSLVSLGTVEQKGCSSSGGGEGVRVSLSVEHTISDESVESVVQPHFVRIKQRRTFLYQPENISHPVWSFDVTIAWSGATKEEAETMQRYGAPSYEIEVECLAPLSYQMSRNEGPECVAQSLLLKLLQLTDDGEEDDGCETDRIAHVLDSLRVAAPRGNESAWL